MNVTKKNSCSPKLLATVEKTGEVFQFAILAQSWSGFPRTLLQQGITACGIETHRTKCKQTRGQTVATGHYRLRYWNFYGQSVLTADQFRCNRALPLAVLKLSPNHRRAFEEWFVATGHYRLRYWNKPPACISWRPVLPTKVATG